MLRSYIRIYRRSSIMLSSRRAQSHMFSGFRTLAMLPGYSCLSDGLCHSKVIKFLFLLVWLSIKVSLVSKPHHSSEKEARGAARETGLVLMLSEIKTSNALAFPMPPGGAREYKQRYQKKAGERKNPTEKLLVLFHDCYEKQWFYCRLLSWTINQLFS